MNGAFKSSRDVIIQTDNLAGAIEFYETILGLPVTRRSDDLIEFETGAFRLYVEKGDRPGPVFDFLVPDMQAAKTQAGGGNMAYGPFAINCHEFPVHEVAAEDCNSPLSRLAGEALPGSSRDGSDSWIILLKASGPLARQLQRVCQETLP